MFNLICIVFQMESFLSEKVFEATNTVSAALKAKIGPNGEISVMVGRKERYLIDEAIANNQSPSPSKIAKKKSSRSLNDSANMEVPTCVCLSRRSSSSHLGASGNQEA